MNNKVCTIGGGSGMPIINKALVKAGFTNISSIVTTFDDGGDSGRMRTDERGQILAFSDYWRSLISLWVDGDQKANWEEMLRFRDGRGRNFGNTFFQFMSEKTGSLSHVDELFSQLTGAKIVGKVVPVALSPAHVCFKTKSGAEYCGEHYLDNLRMSTDKVVKVWLTPNVKANQEAIDVICEADTIIFCPGSMYGSVIINLLPVGIKNAFKKTHAKRILMTNLMSVANENDGFTESDYVNVFNKYLGGEDNIDIVLMANFEKIMDNSFNKVLENYKMEHAFPINYSGLKNKYEVVVGDIAKIETGNFRLRHSVTKLAKLFAKMDLCRREN